MQRALRTAYLLAGSGHLPTCLGIALLAAFAGGLYAWGVVMIVGIVQITIGSVSGFLLNDIIDARSDAINRPYRPIPSSEISPKANWTAFIVCQVIAWVLAISITTTSPAGLMLLAYGLAGTSYSLIKRWLGSFKALYFAVTLLFPVLFGVVLAGASGWDTSAYIAVLLLYVIHREILMDIHDVPGDRAVGARTVATLHRAALASTLAGLAWVLSVGVLVSIEIRGWRVFPAAMFIGSSGLLLFFFKTALTYGWRRFTLFQWIPMVACALLLYPT